MGNAKGPGRYLRHTDLAQLIEQRPIADLKPLCGLLPVPAIFLQHLENDLAFEVLGRLLGNVLERDWLAEVDLGDDASWRLGHHLSDGRLLPSHQTVAPDEILQLW